MTDKHTVIVNMWGGPGVGKTTAAWEICEKLKKEGYVVEYVPEYAKELTWDKNSEALTEIERGRAAKLLNGTPASQLTVLREQEKRIDRCVGQCDFVVTDSPILLGALYMNDRPDNPDLHRLYEKVLNYMVEDHRRYDTFNMRVEREGGESSYEVEGRNQTYQEALDKDQQLSELLNKYQPYCPSYSHKHIDIAISNIKKHMFKSLAKIAEANRPEDTVKVQLIDCQIVFKDAPCEKVNRTFAVGDTEGLLIDNQVFFSVDNIDYLRDMILADCGEDFIVQRVGKPYEVLTERKSDIEHVAEQDVELGAIENAEIISSERSTPTVESVNKTER